MTHVGSGAFGWNSLPPEAFNKDIAPGWAGPSSGGFLEYQKLVNDWRVICSYRDDVTAQIKAVKMRLPKAQQDIVDNFPPAPPALS